MTEALLRAIAVIDRINDEAGEPAVSDRLVAHVASVDRSISESSRTRKACINETPDARS
jgi:hypothetical protein